MNALLKANNLLSQKKLENTIILIKKIAICIIAVVLTVIIFGQGFTQGNALVVKEGSGYSAEFTVNGIGTNTEEYNGHTLQDGTYKVSDLNNRPLGGAVLDLACAAYGGLTSFDTSVLQINTTAPYWNSIDAVYNSIAAVGSGLALFWCLLELIEKASQGHITGEFVLQLGIKFTIATIVIVSGPEIAKGVIELANKITSDMLNNGFGTATATSGADKEFLKVYWDIKKSSWLGCIGAMFPLFLPAVMMKICTIIIFALLAGRIIEVAVRYIFFPIGASDIFSHGMGSPGFRYVKKLFGAALQGIAMYAVVFVGSTLISNANLIVGTAANSKVGGVVITAVFPIIVGISMIGAMLKVSSIINDMT